MTYPVIMEPPSSDGTSHLRFTVSSVNPAVRRFSGALGLSEGREKGQNLYHIKLMKIIEGTGVLTIIG